MSRANKKKPFIIVFNVVIIVPWILARFLSEDEEDNEGADE